jgi:hypothetical protein
MPFITKKVDKEVAEFMLELNAVKSEIDKLTVKYETLRTILGKMLCDRYGVLKGFRGHVESLKGEITFFKEEL